MKTLADQMTNYILNASGEPVPEPDLAKWAKWFEDIDNRRVAETQVGVETIFTTFLGVDHRFGGSGPPLLYETMSKNLTTGEWSDEQDRYVTRAEAVAGHESWVAKLKARSTA